MGLEQLKSLAETSWSWGAILIIALYMIYTLYEKKIKYKKEKAEKIDDVKFKRSIQQQMYETSSVNKELLKYLKITSEKYIDEVNEPQAKIIINSIINCSENDIINYCTKVVASNNIKGNENEISDKLASYINNRTYKSIILLKEFKLKEHTLDELFDDKWKNKLIDSVLSLILNYKPIKDVESTIKNHFEEFKNKMLYKIS